MLVKISPTDCASYTYKCQEMINLYDLVLNVSSMMQRPKFKNSKRMIKKLLVSCIFVSKREVEKVLIICGMRKFQKYAILDMGHKIYPRKMLDWGYAVGTRRTLITGP